MAVRRKIFIGDVQGCREELSELVDRLRFDPVRDDVHLVGDLVRRGPDSLGVLRLAEDLDATWVLGNHEVYLLERGFFADELGDAARAKWAEEPGLVGLLDSDERCEWGRVLTSTPLLLEVDDLVMVHAALPPPLWPEVPPPAEWRRWTSVRLGDPDPPPAAQEFVLSTRYCDRDGRRPAKDWPPPAPPFVPWDLHYRGRRTVVFGHWARRGLVHDGGVRGLDTGCVYGGRLTAWIADEDRFVHVDARRKYYGRR
ncbi:MAG: metallophosphoesterase [Planctomycetota bacterium]